MCAHRAQVPSDRPPRMRQRRNEAALAHQHERIAASRPATEEPRAHSVPPGAQGARTRGPGRTVLPRPVSVAGKQGRMNSRQRLHEVHLRGLSCTGRCLARGRALGLPLSPRRRRRIPETWRGRRARRRRGSGSGGCSARRRRRLRPASRASKKPGSAAAPAIASSARSRATEAMRGSERPSRPAACSSAGSGAPSRSAAARSAGGWWTMPASSTSGAAYHSGATASADRTSAKPLGRTSGKSVVRCARHSSGPAHPSAFHSANGRQRRAVAQQDGGRGEGEVQVLRHRIVAGKAAGAAAVQLAPDARAVAAVPRRLAAVDGRAGEDGGDVRGHGVQHAPREQRLRAEVHAHLHGRGLPHHPLAAGADGAPGSASAARSACREAADRRPRSRSAAPPPPTAARSRRPARAPSAAARSPRSAADERRRRMGTPRRSARSARRARS